MTSSKLILIVQIFVSDLLDRLVTEHLLKPRSRQDDGEAFGHLGKEVKLCQLAEHGVIRKLD